MVTNIILYINLIDWMFNVYESNGLRDALSVENYSGRSIDEILEYVNAYHISENSDIYKPNREITFNDIVNDLMFWVNKV